MKVKRIVAYHQGREIYGTYPYSEDDLYCWFSHYNGNTADCKFLFDNKALRGVKLEITIKEYEI